VRLWDSVFAMFISVDTCLVGKLETMDLTYAVEEHESSGITVQTKPSRTKPSQVYISRWQSDAEAHAIII
jgi:hypothetical protein